MNKVPRFLSYTLLILAVCTISVTPVVAPLPVLANAGSVSINLRVTGSGPTDIINETGYPIPSGNITVGDVTVDQQTAMGALIYYCQQQEPKINIVVADYGGGAYYVVQIGDNTTDYNNWVYAYNERVNWVVGAADQPVADGNSVHWFNYLLGYYQLLLEIDKTKIVQGENITATVTWTSGPGTTEHVESAGVYASDNFGMYQPEPGQPVGNTDASGELTFSWNTVGQFWPYAETTDDRTSISQYPVPTFECAAVSATISLSPGWNFISTPKKLKEGYHTKEWVFRGIDTGEPARSIWLYNAFASPPWGTGMTNSDEVKPLDGIWIYSTKEDKVYFVFDTDPRRVPPTKQLYAGWNAIGFSDTDNVSANSALTSVEAQWAYLMGFDASIPDYEPSIINNDQSGGDRDESNPMLPGKGYWLYMTDDGELAAIGM